MDAFADPTIDTVVVMTCSQVGKALAIDTPIATYQGWSTMGDLKPGDIVFGKDGKPTKVLGVSPIMENRDCYKVCFSDGSEIVADSEHLWSVDEDKKLSLIKTTKTIFDTFKKGDRNVYAIPVAKPLETETVDLPINPYVLGAWLGDGHSFSSKIYGNLEDITEIALHIKEAGYRTRIEQDKTCHAVRIDEKLDYVCPKGHDKNVTGWINSGCRKCHNLSCKNNVRKTYGRDLENADEIVMTLPRLLTKNNLFKNKHIPKEYLRASKEQRLALLQGLMDTDGTISVKGRCEFVTTSKQIAEGFSELLHSLGIKHTQKEKIPHTTYKSKKVYGKKAYRFSFLVYKDTPVFRLTRKLNRHVSRKGRRTTETERRRIVFVQKTESVPVRCILVDSSDHLFLAGRSMIPTHNTEVVNNIVGFFISQDPSPILVVQPTLDMAQTWSKDRLAPMLRDTPVLQGLVKDPRSRDSGNTTLHKSFPGGHITACGANSPSSLASRPIRIVLCDEVDRYPISAGSEGDPVSLARKRSATFWNRKIGMFSTPTNKGASRIEAAFEESDKRSYHVPCPHCGFKTTLKWAQVRWEEDKPETANYVCEDCGSIWTDADRIRAIRHGDWIAEHPGRRVAGFRLSGLYSPWTPLESAVSDFLEAKKQPATLRVFVNTFLGETWEEAGESVDDYQVAERREDFGESVPREVLLLTAGVDVQDDRLEVEIVGWGKDEESWSLDYRTLYGDPSSPAVWQDLDNILSQQFEREDGKLLIVRSACVDSGGHHTNSVYNYVRPREGKRIFAIKGVGGEGKPIVGRPSTNNIGKIRLFPVGVDTAKQLLFSRLKITEAGPGYCHFPNSRNDEYFRQLTAEKVVTKYHKGFARREFVKTRPRNEALDVRVYSMAAFAILNLNINTMHKREFMQHENPPEPEREQPLTQKLRRPVQKNSGFINSWR